MIITVTAYREILHAPPCQPAPILPAARPACLCLLCLTARCPFRSPGTPGYDRRRCSTSAVGAFYRADELAVPRHKTVVVTCAHGPRAGIGKFALKRAGFENIVYLDGHMSGWYKSGLPVATGMK